MVNADFVHLPFWLGKNIHMLDNNLSAFKLMKYLPELRTIGYLQHLNTWCVQTKIKLDKLIFLNEFCNVYLCSNLRIHIKITFIGIKTPHSMKKYSR